ncbi:MAG: Xaa-Pro peptidase family protein [Blastocatellia bacterium]|nr:Xaa-Pro peptidase family protein [Blastocatellia bacterium]
MKTRFPNACIASRIVRTIAIVAVMAAAFAVPTFINPTAAEDGLLANQPKSEYRARRQKLMEQIKNGIVVLVGAREEDLGEVGRFRQKNDIMYLTGMETPAAYFMLIPPGLLPDKAAKEIIFIPPRNPRRERWTGIQIGPGQEGQQKFGIQEAASSADFYKRLFEILNSSPFKSEDSAARARLYTIVPGGSNATTLRESLFVERIRKEAPHVQIEDVSPLLGELRKTKSAAEIALLQKAIDITGEAQRDVARTIKPGAYEYEVQAALEYAFARNGAERPGFPSIVGSGFYSTILHYNENRKRIEAGDLIVVDIGAEYSYYTADITRTYPASGKFTPRQREIYQLVLDAQRACEKAFKPGESTMAQLTQVARKVMQDSPLRDRAGNTLDRYFIHGLGHWLGMDVHDVGNYAPPLPPNSVITIEPGIYIPEEKLGVRIEDDYLVTDKGLVKMSGKIPSDPDEIERLMSSGMQAKPASSSSSKRSSDR